MRDALCFYKRFIQYIRYAETLQYIPNININIQCIRIIVSTSSTTIEKETLDIIPSPGIQHRRPLPWQPRCQPRAFYHPKHVENWYRFLRWLGNPIYNIMYLLSTTTPANRSRI